MFYNLAGFENMIQYQRGYSCIMTNVIQRQAFRSAREGLRRGRDFGVGGTSSLKLTSSGSKETLGPVQLLRAPLPGGTTCDPNESRSTHSTKLRCFGLPLINYNLLGCELFLDLQMAFFICKSFKFCSAAVLIDSKTVK